MKVITDIYDFSALPCAATVGSFDGVHCGHRAMLAELRAVANEKGLPLMVVTFTRHPRLLFDGECEPFLLTTNDEKMALLDSMGVDYCVLLDFDSCMAAMSAGRFMKEVLVGQLGVQLLGVGYDHHFGSDRLVGFSEYEHVGNRVGLRVLRAYECLVDSLPVSSSRIRKLLADAKIEYVNRLLGYTYSISGAVEHGRAIGSTIGFPTANIRLDSPKQLPAPGVYIVCANVDGVEYKALANIGTNPTVGNDYLSLEVHLLDFEGDLYDKRLVISFQSFVREEKKFASLSELQAQIKEDVKQLI